MRRFTTSTARTALQDRKLHAKLTTSPPVQITTLPNGIRVATEATPGHFSAVGLYVDAGSRYETKDNSGVSHFLDRMAFKVIFFRFNTTVFADRLIKSTHARTDGEMSTAIHKLGGQIQCASSREAIMYQSSQFNNATPLALSIIADTVTNAAFSPEEILAQRDATRYEIREISSKPEMILPEVLHQVAYGGEGLGNPLLCPEERIDLIDADTLRDFMQNWYRPERIVIAGAGMVHEDLVELTDKYFSSLKPSQVLSKQVPLS